MVAGYLSAAIYQAQSSGKKKTRRRNKRARRFFSLILRAIHRSWLPCEKRRSSVR
jgi:hypothetical protein